MITVNFNELFMMDMILIYPPSFFTMTLDHCYPVPSFISIGLTNTH